MAQALHDDDLFGLLRVRLQPPRKLLHPIISTHGPGGKLLFPLCKTCALEGGQDPCTHSAEDRALEGTYTSLEVAEALRMGYTLEKTWEVWHFRERSTTLLRSFIFNLFLEKEYCSGWPANRTTPAAREAYAKQLSAWYGGLPVDPNRFRKNPAGRQLGDLLSGARRRDVGPCASRLRDDARQPVGHQPGHREHLRRQ